MTREAVRSPLEHAAYEQDRRSGRVRVGELLGDYLRGEGLDGDLVASDQEGVGPES